MPAKHPSDQRIVDAINTGKLAYLTKLPREVPFGKALVHNSVAPSRRQGFRGARFWLQDPSDRLIVCDCSWASELGPHYRVRSDGDRAREA
jgi:hypothetical protein